MRSPRRQHTGWRLTSGAADRSVVLGLAIMVVTEAATLAGIEPFASWNTPIAWTGFILFSDSIVYRVRGGSWMRSAPGEFTWLALASIPFWILFEGYNLVLRNWYYTGLPESFWLRQIGFAWAFATIWPAIFEGAELVAVWRDRGRHDSGLLDPEPESEDRRGAAVGGVLSYLSIAGGAIMLALPFIVSPEAAQYLAAPVWLGFIFLFEPINRSLGLEALTRERSVNLALSGLVCGLLWEFWNYWSRAKWHYTVPIMEHHKLFEMPLAGYLGFPAFALECFTLYVFVRRAFTTQGRTIAL
jgi:hypothetical protein